MAESHVLDLQALLDRLAAQIGATGTIECKRFFSGAAAWVDGQIFISLTPVGLALKLPEPERTALLAAGARPLRYFPNAPIKKKYVILPTRIAADMAALAPLVSTSLRFVSGLRSVDGER